MTSMLKIDDLHKRYGDTRAVAGLSLDIAEKEVYGLIGPDGAGKTTAMRMIIGLIRADQGTVSACGYPVPSKVRSARQLIGYMPQQFSLYGDLSVQENLRFFAGMYGVPPKELKDREGRLLEIARLNDYRHRAAGALSGGMYKKLALACALVHHPRLLLLDEPTNGVDPISRRELWAFLYELVQEGVTVLVSTPYMDEAERCNRVGLLIDGKLATEGNPAQMRNQFKETVFQVEAEPLGVAQNCLVHLDKVSRVYTVGKKLHAVSPRGLEFIEEMEKALVDSHVKVTGIERIQPSFEDIFLYFSSLLGRDTKGDTHV